MLNWERSPSFLPRFCLLNCHKAFKEMIAQLEYSLNKQLDTVEQFKLDFDMDRAPEAVHFKKLQNLINRLKDVAKEKSRSKASEKADREGKGKRKKMITQKCPKSRVLKSRFSCPTTSSSSEEKQGAAPLLTKSKKSTKVSKTQDSLATQSPNASIVHSGMTTVGLATKSPLGAAVKTGFGPSPDEDDNLTSKKMNTKHS